MPLARKRVLMICYYYPPAYNSGVERSVKFAEYLPRYGWSPVVLTTDAFGATNSADAEQTIRTPELLSAYRWLFNKDFRELKRAGRRAAVLPPTTPNKGWKKFIVDLILRWLFVPDVQVGWIVFAFSPAWRLLRGDKADAIYTTSPTESSHLLGLALKILTGKPWVMDLRDPWTFEPVSERLRRPGPRLSIERRMEHLCMRHADAIVINTPQAAARYRSLYPAYAHKMRTITNGFDSEEIAHAVSAPGQSRVWRAPDDDRFLISHAGKFFRFEGGDQTPHAFLNALKMLLDEQAISADKCRVVLAGNLHRETLTRISELGLDDLVETPGVISHFDATRLTVSSDLLLLFDSEKDGQTYVRGKLYEYLGSKEPVLGMVPDGASRELLERSGRGTLVYPGDVGGIRRAIVTSFERRNVIEEATDFDANLYERKWLTSELAALLDDLADVRSARSGARAAMSGER